MAIPVVLEIAAARRLVRRPVSTWPAKGRPCFRSEAGPRLRTSLPVARCLASQFGDHGEQRHVERDHDAADTDAQYGDDDRLEHGPHVPGVSVHLLLLE